MLQGIKQMLIYIQVFKMVGQHWQSYTKYFKNVFDDGGVGYSLSQHFISYSVLWIIIVTFKQLHETKKATKQSLQRPTTFCSPCSTDLYIQTIQKWEHLCICDHIRIIKVFSWTITAKSLQHTKNITFWRSESQGNLMACFKECNNTEGTDLHPSAAESLYGILVQVLRRLTKVNSISAKD